MPFKALGENIQQEPALFQSVADFKFQTLSQTPFLQKNGDILRVFCNSPRTSKDIRDYFENKPLIKIRKFLGAAF
ncbi:hypothetical protein [Novacetimonas hansenii]|uniref:hypothetical protein n=1 Tax=Novacetimonas hansenii TaxID=436 RepID=UPI001C4BC0D9|nr:hypothetical protein [Novacetimonas hansenii]